MSIEEYKKTKYENFHSQGLIELKGLLERKDKQLKFSQQFN